MTDKTELTREEVQSILDGDRYDAQEHFDAVALQLLAAMDDNARLRFDLDRAAADENASTAEAESLRAELAEARAALSEVASVAERECPCCTEASECHPDCTFASDCPDEADDLENWRAVRRIALTTMEPPDAD